MNTKTTITIRLQGNKYIIVSDNGIRVSTIDAKKLERARKLAQQLAATCNTGYHIIEK